MPAVVYALPLEHFIIWWELELHAIFKEMAPVANPRRPRLDRSFALETNYRLLDTKFK
jgi:hypothetical protein